MDATSQAAKSDRPIHARSGQGDGDESHVPVAPACAMVIFGAAGDLTKRLLIPAVYNLVKSGMLPEGFRLVGVDLVDMSAEEWCSGLHDTVQEFASKGEGQLDGGRVDRATWDWIGERMSYVQGDFGDPETFKRLGSHLDSLDGTEGNHLFYLAVVDRFFGPVVAALGEANLTGEEDGKWRRVVIEKPFGHDLASAQELNASILETLEEHQIYRMDHFLGKETVQNIMALRFANGLFEPLWNREHIDHIQITVAETVGVEHRAAFYEKTGALRDMVPNHVFQLLALTAMEPPISFDASAVRAKKAEVIEAIRPMSEETALREAVRGQYDAGTVEDSQVPPYRREPDVATDSPSETFFACKFMIDNWRWAGVPFYLRTGKRMQRRTTEIAIRFHQAPFMLFRGTQVKKLGSNWLVLRIQPEEGIAMEFDVKCPGPSVRLSKVSMDFCYEDYFSQAPRTGYETLLYDCMIGDATLFQHADQIEAGWQAVQPILDAWASNPPTDFPNYPAGGTGPATADELLARDGHSWRPLD